jgi:hypothetical protein
MRSVTVSDLKDDPDAAAEWDHDVRPRLGRDRADHGWSWQSLYRFTLIPLRPRKGFVLRADGRVVGLVLSNPRSYLLTDREQLASYVWFMSAAPSAPVERIGRGLLFCVVRESFLVGHRGCISLHADPGGGADLLQIYQRLGLLQVPGNLAGYPVQGAVSRLRNQQPNDGRFFELTCDAARAFVARTHALGMLG